MASGPALSTVRSGYIYIGSETRDSFSLLDVLYANQFEGESLTQNVLEKAEVNFYRGAPPEWLNFHFSEQATSRGIGTPLIKRDGYDALVEQIDQRKRRPGISEVKLFHQPGCGGTTMAMQVLWDLRRTFRCAVLTGSSSDITKVAEEVTNLFTAGRQNNQNTVLLLLNDEQMLKKLQECVMMRMAELKIDPSRHVAILLSCVRKDEVLQSGHVVLREHISSEEQQKFNEKKKELCRRYSDRYEQFHGFNIMQTNFSQQYINQACTEFRTNQKAKRPLKTQLAACISLLNAYVPGSYLLESQCLNFLKPRSSIHDGLSLEDRMKPFGDLIITFRPDARSETKVRMVHPMMAQCCCKFMVEAGVTTSDTARNFLTCFCRDEIPPFLLGFVKDMLTKREMKKGASLDADEKQELFSKLILDIKSQEDPKKSVSVLKVASRKFHENPFFPQALARFYYIELKEYNQAERWAKTAKLRDPQNSFVADTLGQVHKNHLKNKGNTYTPREILRLAAKAIDAFKDEERLAENEQDTDMIEDGMSQVSHLFNTRGQFGYLQVCSLLYDLLVSQNKTWEPVLKKNKALGSVLTSLGDNKLDRFSHVIKSLRDDVERKCIFFGKYLTYSKPDKKDDPSYISADKDECYSKYVSNSPSKHFRQNPADTSAGAFTFLHREYTQQELEEIAKWGKKICLRKYSAKALVNYIYAQIMLINKNPRNKPKDKVLAAFGEINLQSPRHAPEFHMLALLLNWPSDSEEEFAIDYTPLIERMRSSYEHAYKAYFRTRCLQPLFFIGKGQAPDRIIHRTSLEEMCLQETRTDIWKNEEIFQNPVVQELLLEVEGEVRDYRVYATTGGTQIEVEANLQNSLWRPRHVQFYIGFTIRGPVAFGIRTKTA